MTINEEALAIRLQYNGILTTASKVPLKDRHDLSVLYTPGVAEPCKIIKENKDLSFDYTCRGNMVAIISDGTRVLGLGDIGPEAGLPVMEGKAVLFKTFGDVDAIPLCLDTKDPDKFIETVRLLQPSFAGINLEDISSPKCYDIECKLKEICDIPVFHDDQHGTAIALMSAVIGALRFVKKDLKTAKVVVNGCGAAGSAIGRLLVNMGAENVTMVDRFGALYDGIDAPLDRVQDYLKTVTNKNKEKGMKVLRARLYEMLQEQKNSELAQERKSQVGTGDRSERIRTYNFPQGRVTDHRIGLTIHRMDDILDGNIDEIIDALITDDQAKRLKGENE